MLALDDLPQGLGLEAEERAAVYRDAALQSRYGGEEYRHRQFEPRQFPGRPSTAARPPENDTLAEPLAERRSAPCPACDAPRSLEHDGLRHRTCSQCCRSYIHPHANRLLGTYLQHEQLVMQLFRRMPTPGPGRLS